MLKQFTIIGSPIHPAEEVSEIIDMIKVSNDEMNTGKITLKTERILMEIYFEASLIHIYNYLIGVKSTLRILLVETEI